MKKRQRISDEEIIEAFRKAGLAYGDCSDRGDYKKANLASREMNELKKEIVSRGEETKIALLRLLEDSDAWVRFGTAASSLDFAPDRAFAVLTELSSFPMSIGAAAFACLRMWETGAPRA